MYVLGKLLKRRLSYVALMMVGLLTIGSLGVLYWYILHKSSQEGNITNTQPLNTTVADNSGKNSLEVNEPLFSMVLPGSWKLAGTNVDGAYRSIQWQYIGGNSAGRWMRVYVDTIPASFGVNYLLPVSAESNGLKLGTQSDSCVSFTKGATPDTTVDKSTPIKMETLPSRWELVDFVCQNSRVSHRMVGTGSTQGITTVFVTGPIHGRHAYFFVYNDDNYRPDFSIFKKVLTSFRAK